MPRLYRTIAAQTQIDIVSEYQPGQRGKGLGSLARKYSLSKATVEGVIKRAREYGGDPIRPRGHKRRKLSANEEKKLVQAAMSPQAPTLQALAHSTRNKICKKTVREYLLRQTPPITSKIPVKVDPKEESKAWKATMRAFIKNTLGKIPQNHRVYQDETPIYANEARKKARAPRGTKAVRSQLTYARKYTLSVYATKHAVLYWDLSCKNANDDEVARIAEAATKKFENGQVLLWDRLGRSGRSANPAKQHYNPEVIRRFNNMGVKVIHLPPLAKWLNPMELLFNDLKEHYVRVKFHPDGSPMGEDELKRIINAYMKKQAPMKLPGFFRERASGRQAKRLELF